MTYTFFNDHKDDDGEIEVVKDFPCPKGEINFIYKPHSSGADMVWITLSGEDARIFMDELKKQIGDA